MTIETCANDEYVARTTTRRESRNLEVDVQTAISNANPRSNERQSLVDIKGLAKPPTFKGESARFTEGLRRTTGFFVRCSVLSFPASD